MTNPNIIKDSTELRKLIAENPELPIVVMIGQEAASSDWYWTYCTDVRCGVGEVLDYECPWNDERIYDDREEFEEDLWDYLSDFADTVPELEEEFKRSKEDYAQHWHKAIIIRADN
jgi:hypothetical protein